MSKKRHKCSTRFIRKNYTYTVDQIADLFGIEASTVKRWIREDGLVRIPKVRPYLVHSTDLRAFIDKKNKEKKKPCKENEIFCMKCQRPRIPLLGSGSTKKQPNKSLLFKAKCSVCNSKMNRPVSIKKWSKTHPLAQYLKEAPKQHNREYPTPRKCNIQKGEQLCLNITL
ncbi:MAG: helix-turn-helix domain-containing protein [Alphaproteobacteria bacterium]